MRRDFSSRRRARGGGARAAPASMRAALFSFGDASRRFTEPGRPFVARACNDAGGRLYDGRALEPKPPRGHQIDANLLKELRIEGSHRDEGGGPPRWMWPVVGTVVVIAFVAGAAWWYLGSRPVAVQTAVAVAPASGSSAAAVLQATGYVTARRQATVSSQITGTLIAVLIEEGDRVQKGQVLARLDDSALRAAVNAAQANVQSAQAQIVQAQAQLVQAQADEKRQTELAEAGMATRQSGEQARTTAALDAAQLETRRRDADAARAQLAQAQVNLQYATVKAPVKGLVSRKTVEAGQIVQPGQPLMAVIPLEEVWITANFKETQLQNMRAGQRVTVKVDAIGGREFKGTVDSIAAATGARFALLPPENATGNYVKVVQRVPVKILLDPGQDPEHLLRPGLSATPTVYTR